MKFQKISFHRIIITVIIAIILGFFSISIRYFGTTYTGKSDRDDLIHYDDQIRYHKEAYDEYNNLPLLSGFDWKNIGIEVQEFKIPISETNRYTRSDTQEEIFTYYGRVKIPMDEMMSYNNTGFIVRFADPDEATQNRMFFEFYRIMDQYVSRTYLSMIRQYMMLLTSYPIMAKTDFVLMPYGAYAVLGGKTDEVESITCLQFVNNNAIHGSISVSLLDRECKLVLYNTYNFWSEYTYQYNHELSSFFSITSSGKSPHGITLSIQKMK